MFLKKCFPEVSCSDLGWFIPRSDGFYIDIAPYHYTKNSVFFLNLDLQFSESRNFHKSVLLPDFAGSDA